MRIALQQLVLGILLGGLYGLAAAGLSLVFGVLKVLNVAHGELIMLGGYAAFWLATGWGLDPFLSLLGVIPMTAALGLLLYGGLFGFVSASTRRRGSRTRCSWASGSPSPSTPSPSASSPPTSGRSRRRTEASRSSSAASSSRSRAS